MNSARQLAALFRSWQFNFTREAELQEGVALALTLEREEFEREATSNMRACGEQQSTGEAGET